PQRSILASGEARPHRLTALRQIEQDCPQVGPLVAGRDENAVAFCRALVGEVSLLPLAPGAFLPLGIRQAIGTELHEVEDLATEGFADRLRPLRTTVLKDVMQQRRDDLVLVATIALNQSRHRNRVCDVRQWQAKNV